jgi:hypothetical protein
MTWRVALCGVLSLAGCLSLTGCPSGTTEPERPAVTTSSVAATPAPPTAATDTAVASAAPSAAPKVACSPILIRRAGLGDSAACKQAIAAYEAWPASRMACSSDADCRIVPLAGGCLGINAGSGSEPDPLPASCAGACASATFDDHRIRCDQGCCLIYEE